MEERPVETKKRRSGPKSPARVEVCAGIIYPKAPRKPGLRERIEEHLNDYGLQVVWYDD